MRTNRGILGTIIQDKYADVTCEKRHAVPGAVHVCTSPWSIGESCGFEPRNPEENGVRKVVSLPNIAILRFHSRKKKNMQTSGTISRHHRIMEMVGKHTPFFWEFFPKHVHLASSWWHHPFILTLLSSTASARSRRMRERMWRPGRQTTA